MNIRMGISLSALSFSQPSYGKNQKNAKAIRSITDQEMVEKQKAQTLLKANAGKRKSSDMDEFFLKYTEHMDSRVSQSVTKMAKVMSDSKDQHIITTNGDAATDEMKRICEKYGLSPEDLKAINIESQGNAPLSDAQIAALKEQYDVENITGEEAFQLLAELTKQDALSSRSFFLALPVFAKTQNGNLAAAHQQTARQLSQFAGALESGNTAFSTGGKATPETLRETAKAHSEIAALLCLLQKQ